MYGICVTEWGSLGFSLTRDFTAEELPSSLCHWWELRSSVVFVLGWACCCLLWSLSCPFELFQFTSLVLAKRSFHSVMASMQSVASGDSLKLCRIVCLVDSWRGERAHVHVWMCAPGALTPPKSHFPFLSPHLHCLLMLKKKQREENDPNLDGCLPAYLLLWVCEGESIFSRGVLLGPGRKTRTHRDCWRSSAFSVWLGGW